MYCIRSSRSRMSRVVLYGPELRTGSWWILQTILCPMKPLRRLLIRMAMHGLTSLLWRLAGPRSVMNACSLCLFHRTMHFLIHRYSPLGVIATPCSLSTPIRSTPARPAHKKDVLNAVGAGLDSCPFYLLHVIHQFSSDATVRQVRKRRCC